MLSSAKLLNKFIFPKNDTLFKMCNLKTRKVMRFRYPIYILAAALTCVSLQTANASFQSSFATLTTRSGTTWYDLNANTANTDFNNTNLGSFDISDQLLLGGQLNVTGGNVEFARIGWAVRNTDTNTLVNSFALVEGTFQEVDNGNDRWVIPNDSNPNVLSSLTEGGNYQLEVYLHGKYNGGGEFFESNSNNNYVATFTAIPEVNSYALLFGFIGVTVVALRQYRRHNNS